MSLLFFINLTLAELMEWDEMLHMNNLAGQEDDTEYWQYIMKNYKNFDQQAWDIFIITVDITSAFVRTRFEDFNILYDPLNALWNKIRNGDYYLGLSSHIRLSILLSCIEMVRDTPEEKPSNF